MKNKWSWKHPSRIKQITKKKRVLLDVTFKLNFCLRNQTLFFLFFQVFIRTFFLTHFIQFCTVRKQKKIFIKWTFFFSIFTLNVEANKENIKFEKIIRTTKGKSTWRWKQTRQLQMNNFHVKKIELQLSLFIKKFRFAWKETLKTWTTSHRMNTKLDMKRRKHDEKRKHFLPFSACKFFIQFSLAAKFDGSQLSVKAPDR